MDKNLQSQIMRSQAGKLLNDKKSATSTHAARPPSMDNGSSFNFGRDSRAGGQSAKRPEPNAPKRLPQSSDLLSCGFTKEEANYLHQAIRAAQMMWFEGDGLVLAKKDAIELHFKAGQSEFNRWVVLAFPVIDMNMDGAVDVALHFLSESYVMAHNLELQFQAAINLETEKLEFLIQLPLEGLSAIELGNMIAQFVEALAQGVKEELSRLMDELR